MIEKIFFRIRRIFHESVIFLTERRTAQASGSRVSEKVLLLSFVWSGTEKA